MFENNTAETAVLSEEESEALALVQGKWPFGNQIPVVVVNLITSLWRDSWTKMSAGQVETNESEYVFHGSDRSLQVDQYGFASILSHIPFLSKKERRVLKKTRCTRRLRVETRGADSLLGGGREFVNERLKQLLSLAVLSPGSDSPIVDEDGAVLLAVRKVDREGKPSPRPRTHPAWYLTHKGTGFWASWNWLAEHGLVTKALWPDRKGRTVRYQPCLLSQEELDELRSILIASEVAEEVGVIKQRAMTVRRDGSLEIGILPHGPVTTDSRDLYQEAHDKASDDTRTRAKAVLEQTRTDTLPWMQDDYDGVPNDADLYRVGDHEGYAGVAPLDPPSREDNKEMRRARYRLGDNIWLGKLDGADVVLMREENVLWSRKTQQYFTPKDRTHPTPVRA